MVLAMLQCSVVGKWTGGAVGAGNGKRGLNPEVLEPAALASSHASFAISLTDRSTEWQASWGFFGRGLRMGECGEAGNLSPAAPHSPKLEGSPI